MANRPDTSLPCPIGCSAIRYELADALVSLVAHRGLELGEIVGGRGTLECPGALAFATDELTNRLISTERNEAARILLRELQGERVGISCAVARRRHPELIEEFHESVEVPRRRRMEMDVDDRKRVLLRAGLVRRAQPRDREHTGEDETDIEADETPS